jgi:ribosomal protein S1
VNYKVTIEAEVIDINIGSIIDVVITNSNKMGFFCKFEKFNVFIPQHYTNSELWIGQSVNVEVLGKRVEEQIICIGKITGD